MPIIKCKSSPFNIKSRASLPDVLPSTDPDSPHYKEPKYVSVSDLNLSEPKTVESGVSAIKVFAPAIPLSDIDESIHQDDSDDSFMHTQSEEDELLENTEEVKLYDFLVAYLRINTSPTDEQFHSLAVAINKDPEYLESVVYKIMALMFEDQELSEDARHLIDEALVTAEYLPAIGESEGLPDLGMDEVSELTEHDGDPR